MSIIQDPRADHIINRAQAILLKPAATWDVIALETTTIKSLYVNYAVLLAAIPAVCGFLGAIFLHVPLVHALGGAVAAYVVSLAGTAVLAVIAEALATRMTGQSNQIQAFKLAVYSATPAWIAGVFLLLPQLAGLSVLGALYSFYLLYLGAPKLMKTPYDKTVGYVLTLIVAFIIVMAIGQALTRV